MDALALKAHQIVSDFVHHNNPVRLRAEITAALLAERRRCARIAEQSSGESGETIAFEILDACGKGPLECGSMCALPTNHDGDCRCGGDDGDGCPA